MKHPENHIFEHTPDSLKEWCVEHGMKPFRAKQILEWVYEKRVIDPAAMSNLSALDKQVLARDMVFESGRVIKHQKASDGVQKLLIEWDEVVGKRGDEAAGHQGTETGENPPPTSPLREGASEPTGLASRLRVVGQPILGVIEGPGGDTRRQTECVMIPSEDQAGPRRTACVSSQVGCPVGCKFCASGLGGLDGNLSAGRIVEQVWKLGTLLGGPKEVTARTGEDGGAVTISRLPRISNVVFMGMGEPLSNFSNVVKAVRTIASLWGLGISARKITISTVGLPKAIERLAEELELPVTLALSLHAPNDKLRRSLIPWAEYTTIAELLKSCQKWFEKTGREITLEYTLLRGVNDRPEHAAELAQLCKTLRANVNLIRYNEVDGLDFKRPRDEDVREFQRLLRAKDINVHIRSSRGRDIAAACGQLRHESAGV